MAEVQVGQVWADRDSREQGRTLRVVAITDAYVYCEVETTANTWERTGRRTRIALKSLPRRFRLVEED